MKRNTRLIAAAIAGLSLATAGVTASAAEYEGASETRWVVDTRGAPPFKRSKTTAPVVDVAALETVETVTVRKRSSQGKPPFKREWVEVPVVDAASLEIVSDDDSKPNFRGKPPFRRH